MIEFHKKREQIVFNEYESRSLSARIALVSFVIYMFFIFFGTDIPFKEKITEVDEIGTSNRINQIVFSTLFLLSTFSILDKKEKLLSVLKEEKFLSLLLFWGFLSIFWSDFSFVSFKRFFQILTTVVVCLAVLLHINPSEKILKYFNVILILYLCVSLFSVLFISGAKDPNFMTWRGLTATKNNLGQVSLISLLISSFLFMDQQGKAKIIAVLMILTSFVLLVGSRSGTAIIAFSITFLLVVVVTVNQQIFKEIDMNNVFIVLLTLTVLGTIASILILEPDFFALFTNLIGKDITFSGRIYLWSDILTEAKSHLMHGCGFAGFWVVNNPDLLTLYQTYVWLPNQAHMGYLDILNELGLVGLSLFILMVLHYFYRLFNCKHHHLWQWIVIAVLIINMQESTLLRQNNFSGVLFIFSYLALFTDKVNLSPNLF